VHGCSKPAKSQRDGLAAQKECLINEISDQIAEILDKKVNGAGNPHSQDQWAKILRLSLSSLCGALERKEATDTEMRDLLVTLSKQGTKKVGEEANEEEENEEGAKIEEKAKRAIYTILSFFINDTAETSNLKELMKNTLGLEEAHIDLLCNKMQDLAKVIKQIRELD
jgi:hypothetical protein